MKAKHNTTWNIDVRGFSLVEMMVSLAIFSIIITASIGALLTIVDANAKAQALYAATTNLSFMMDSMTRTIRTSHTYFCGLNDTGTTNDCLGGSTSIAVTREKDNKRIAYRFDNGGIEEKDGNGNWLRLTSEDVVISKFFVKTTDTAALPNTVQPQVFIVIEGYINNGLDTNTSFALQTNITERLLDF